MPLVVGRKRFEKLLDLKMPPDKLALVMEAYRLAKYGHKGQERDNGIRYFEHPKHMVLILIREFEIFDYEMIIAALLHDAVEDSFIFGAGEEAFVNIRARFGERAARFVRLLTKDRCSDEEKPERDRLYFERINDQADRDARILKCVDRLDNLRDLMQCSPEKKRHYLEETEAHFLPMARDLAVQLPEPYSQKMLRAYNEMVEICEETRLALD